MKKIKIYTYSQLRKHSSENTAYAQKHSKNTGNHLRAQGDNSQAPPTSMFLKALKFDKNTATFQNVCAFEMGILVH